MFVDEMMQTTSDCDNVVLPKESCGAANFCNDSQLVGSAHGVADRSEGMCD